MVASAAASPKRSALIVGRQPSSPTEFSSPSSWHACHAHAGIEPSWRGSTAERATHRAYSRSRCGSSARRMDVRPSSRKRSTAACAGHHE